MAAESKMKGKRLPRMVVRERREFDNTFHPGLESADLVHEVHGFHVGGPQIGPDECRLGEEGHQLCQNCGWTSSFQREPYTSRLKVMYVRRNLAIWELGSKGAWLLRDETNNSTDPGKKDYAVQQFVRKEKPSIPLVEMHRFGGGADDKFNFTIMARAKGDTISKLWDTLTLEQQIDVMSDLKEHVKQWRQITRPQMQTIDGSALRDPFIGDCTGWGCIKVGRDEDEWLENLTPAVRKHLLWMHWSENKGSTDQKLRDSWVKEVDEKIAQLKASFPRGGPYILTHGDLNDGNIFISDDNEEKKFKVSAIIDWECAGFLPWWVENMRVKLPFDIETLGTEPNMYYPEHEVDELKKILPSINEWFTLWQKGGFHSWRKHGLDQANSWYTEPFCECKPYRREIRDDSLGWEQEHEDVFYVDSSDSELDEDEVFVKFTKFDRPFLRWLGEISTKN